MLPTTTPLTLTDLDRLIFTALVPPDHYLRQVAAVVDFERFRPRLADAYNATLGRTPIDPVRMLKILFLRFHYRLSDLQVVKRTETDIAFRWFLDLSTTDPVPHSTNGTHFRQRMGAERFTQVFHEVVTVAREHGLVNDRLRLKDATHLLADVADVKPLQLAAQVRDRLLQAAKPFFPDWVSEQPAQIETLRQTTAELPDDERLGQRLAYLGRLTAQLQERVASLPTTTGADAKRQRLDRALALVAKLLQDQADPEAGDRLASAMDADARCGKHGEFFLGYLLDMVMDPDSEIITALHVLPGNGAEAADAIRLIQQEEAAQGNQVEGLSMDGIGYNGPVLRELTDPAGLNWEVTVPPPQTPLRSTFGPERFALTVFEDGTAEVTCPNGQTTRQRERIDRDTGFKYVFGPKQCTGCPLREQCLQNPASKKGRKVIKNDYEADYQKVHAKAATAEYEQTRRTHAKVERKLCELVRHHGLRQACFRGQDKVESQGLLTGWVVNVKRIVRLVLKKAQAAAWGGTVRAEWAET